MPLNPVAQLWKYVDSPETKQAIMTIQGVAVYLKYPAKGITYSKGEMLWGIVIQAILSIYIFALLIIKASEYGAVNLLISWWLLVCNVLALVCKAIVYNKLASLRETLPADCLRIQMKIIFAKRIYYYNVICTALCLVNNLICIPLSVILWRYEDEVPDFFIYSTVFIMRYFYSMYRFSNYFMGTKDANNPFGLPEIIYGDPMTEVSYPKLQERNRCSICLQKFKSAEKLVEFSCGNGHFFHLNCLTQWLATNPSCPLCKKQFFDN